MKIIQIIFVVIAVFLSQVAITGQSPTNNVEQEWLKIADAYRQPADSMRVTTRVRLFKEGKETRDKIYEVYLKSDRRSLVVFQSSGEKGQKVLMLEDKFWMIMPKSRRPVRITPMQKLLGEASTGDIATLSWHEDYLALKEGEQQYNDEVLDVLLLEGVGKGLSYKTIRLFLEQSTHRPVKAEFYMASGKLAKNAAFIIEDSGSDAQVSKMILTDAIQKGRITEVEYLNREIYELDDRFYNPRYLAKNRKVTIK